MFLEYDFKQRSFDGKWERLARVKDFENEYSYQTPSGQTVTLTPEKWVTIGVYDYIMEIV